MGLCRFSVCERCDIKFCVRALWLKEIIEGRCPYCETRYWYRVPVYEDPDRCDCYVQSCDNCGVVLCS
jgi:hypothetical protein